MATSSEKGEEAGKLNFESRKNVSESEKPQVSSDESIKEAHLLAAEQMAFCVA